MDWRDTWRRYAGSSWHPERKLRTEHQGVRSRSCSPTIPKIVTPLTQTAILEKFPGATPSVTVEIIMIPRTHVTFSCIPTNTISHQSHHILTFANYPSDTWNKGVWFLRVRVSSRETRQSVEDNTSCLYLSQTALKDLNLFPLDFPVLTSPDNSSILANKLFIPEAQQLLRRGEPELRGWPLEAHSGRIPLCQWSYLSNPSARAGYDTWSIFKRSLTGLNSEFSFS